MGIANPLYRFFFWKTVLLMATASGTLGRWWKMPGRNAGPSSRRGCPGLVPYDTRW